MSKEDFHNDLLSRLDPETVQKALERYNRKNSNVGLHNDNESVASGVPSKSLESLPSTPRHHKNSIVIPVDQYLYAKHPNNLPSPHPERKMKESLHRVKSGSSISSLAAVSPAISPFLGKKDSSDYEVAKNILTDVEFDMESLASGIESEPVQENMKGINQWIQSPNKKKKKISKRDRKKSSTAGLGGRGHQPPVGVVEPRTILSHLDNALDIAEMHKGQGAILEKVSVVTKPKAKLGHHNGGFSAGSSDNLSDTPSPGSSHHSRGVFPNKRKKSSIANFMDKALPNRKKKSETEQVIMFKFQNPNLASEVNDNVKKVTLNLEAGEELNEVSDVDSIQSFTDDDVLDLDHEKRIRAKYKEKLEQRRHTIQSTKSIKSNFSHTTLVDEQMYENKKLPKISLDHVRDCDHNGDKSKRNNSGSQRYPGIHEENEYDRHSINVQQNEIEDENANLRADANHKKISESTVHSVNTVVESEVGNKSQNNCLESPTIKSATLSTQSSLPDYNEVIKDVRKNEVMHARNEHNASPKSTLTHQDSSKFLTVNQHQRKLSTSLTIDDDDDWDKRSIRSIRSYVSNNIPGSPSGLGSTTSEAVTDEERKVIKEQELKEERRERFWDYFTFIGSMVWAMLIVVIGCVLYAQDIFVHGHKRGSHRTQYYNMCLCIVGIAIFITLIVDINKYISMMKTYWQKGAEAPKIELVEGEDGELMISIPISSAPKKLPQYYGFTTGRHSGSMFLKIGAAVFCVLHIIHLFLIIVKEAITLQSNDCCESRETITRNFFHVIFVVLQLYMTFKYSNVIVNRSKGLARFAFMHCIGSSLCFWINTIIDETLDTLVEKLTKSEDTCHPEDYHSIYGPNYYNNLSMIHGQFDECNVNNRSNLVKNDTLHYLEMCTKKIYNWTERCYKADPNEPIFSFNVDCLLAKECMCTYDNHAANTIFSLGPFLYPFGIEFSLLVVGVWYIMWDNIGRVKENQRDMEFIPDARRDSINSVDGTPINEALLVYADCHSTTKGLFVGLILFAFSTTGFIVFLVLSGSPDCDNQTIAVTLNDVIEILILLVMIVVSFYLYGWRIAHLDVNPNPISFLDDLLLIVCLPSSFFYCILSILPSVTGDYSDPGNVMTQICMMLQVIIQTALIVDGLRRCSDGQHNQVQRPGKNLITFLIVANLSLWLWETMEAKATGEYYHIRKKYYGAELWTIIAHTTLPLSIFYRFHSAVALADIWSSAYKPGDHH